MRENKVVSRLRIRPLFFVCLRRVLQTGRKGRKGEMEREDDFLIEAFFQFRKEQLISSGVSHAKRHSIYEGFMMVVPK